MTTWTIERKASANPKSGYKRAVETGTWALAWFIWCAIVARDGMRYRFKRNGFVIARKK